MAGINVKRWLLGGLAAGVFIFIFEGLASQYYFEAVEEAMDAAGLSMDMSAGAMIQAVLVSLLMGMVAVFFYAAARPRFGPGPKTALTVAIALFLGSYLVSIVGYRMLGLFPDSLLLPWAVVGLIEIVLGTLLGAWLYQE